MTCERSVFSLRSVAESSLESRVPGQVGHRRAGVYGLALGFLRRRLPACEIEHLDGACAGDEAHAGFVGEHDVSRGHAHAGHFDLAMKLLERGADPRLGSDAGATPLFAAINTFWAPKSRYPQQHAYMLQNTTYLDLMSALLKAGADPNARLKKHVWYMSYTFDLLDVDTRGCPRGSSPARGL